jgi:hypothetical protein
MKSTVVAKGRVVGCAALLLACSATPAPRAGETLVFEDNFNTFNLCVPALPARASPLLYCHPLPAFL